MARARVNRGDLDNVKAAVRIGWGTAVLLALALLVLPATSSPAATFYWDGGGDGVSWSVAANWNNGGDDGVPLADDDAILDNSFVAVSYTVILPGGSERTDVRTVAITPTVPGAFITLVLPSSNTNNPGFRVGPSPSVGEIDAMIIGARGVMQNSSGANGGTGVSFRGNNDLLRIDNGGRFLHNTRRSNAGIVSQLSVAPGTERGVFEFDVPGASYAVSFSDRVFGSVTFTKSSGTGAYTVTGLNPVTIRGDLTLNPGATLTSTMGAALNLRGYLISDGNALTLPATQPVNLNGSVEQHIQGGSPVTFDGPTTVNNAAGVVLDRDLSINGSLALTAGLVTLGASNLTLGTATTITRTVDPPAMLVPTGTGEVRKLLTAPGAFEFTVGDNDGTAEYSPATLDFTAGTFAPGAYAAVRLAGAQHPLNTPPTDVLTRFWTITSSGISDHSCNVTLQYLPADVVGTEANLWGIQWDGSFWKGLAPVDSTNHWVVGTVTGFSDFTAGFSQPGPDFFVNTPVDEVTEGCTFPHCSLREAVNAANALAGADSIWVPEGAYQLTLGQPGGAGEDNNATGDLDITESVTVNGAGSATTLIDAVGQDRAFHLVLPGTVATFNGLRIFNGNNSGADGSGISGGGILAAGGTGVRVLYCELLGNTGQGSGGAVGVNSGSELTIQFSVLAGNQNQGAGSGGAVFAIATPVSISASSFEVNIAAAPGSYGGALSLMGVPTGSILASTFVGNRVPQPAPGSGGGGLFAFVSTLDLTNCTFTDNWAGDPAGLPGSGGGIYVNGGTVSLTHLTMSGNYAASGGALMNNAAGAGTVQYGNVIMANSIGGPDCSGGVPAPWSPINIVEDGSCPSMLAVDPLLGPLADNGGPTRTMALLPGSLAIDSGVLPGVPVPFDQRGVARPQLVGFDLGAYESRGFDLTITGGNDQATLIGTGFAVPLSVNLVEIGGGGLAGAAITFTPPPEPGATAVITGSPATTDGSGNASVTATANLTVGGPYAVTADAGGGVTVDFSLTNLAPVPPTITSLAETTWVIGQAGTFLVTATGLPLPVISETSGNLPGWADLTPNGDGTATLAGAPLAGSVSDYPLHFQAVGAPPPAEQPFVLHVTKADTTTQIVSHLPSPSLVGEIVTVTYTVTVSAPGSGAPTGSVQVTDNGAPGCSGTVAASSCSITFTTPGTHTLVATYDGDGDFNSSASGPVDHVVSCPTITLAPETLPDATQWSYYQQLITAAGGTAPYSFDLASGPLPAGLVLSPVGELSGTPEVAGLYSFIVRATDDTGCTGERTYTLSIDADVPTDVMLRLGNPGPVAGSIDVTTPGLSCGATCAQWIPWNDPVHLTAVPAPGNELVRWLGDCSGSSLTCDLTMDSDKLAIAVFKPIGDRYTPIHHFVPGFADGQDPYYGALLAEGGYLYGLTMDGGILDRGTIFRERPDGSQHVILHDFSGAADDGAYPFGSLIAHGGRLYGMTSEGGANGLGTIFSLDPVSADLELVYSFAGAPGDGAYPYGGLIAISGVLYGTTNQGGSSDAGTIFSINPDGTGMDLLHELTGGSDGGYPYGSLIASGGVLYGLTRQGGDNGGGTLFATSLDGTTHDVLHHFGGAGDGLFPLGALKQIDSVLYGTTNSGGPDGFGTIFAYDTDPVGTGYNLLHSFTRAPGDGAYPTGGLAEEGGVLYGVTPNGGIDDAGIVYSYDPTTTTFTPLHELRWDGLDGATALGSLTASNGQLFGMTRDGGVSNYGTTFRLSTDGSFYQVMHSFCAAPGDAWDPIGTVIFEGGALYGMTQLGGAGRQGTIYRVNPDGTGYQVLYDFMLGYDDGGNPYGSLLAAGGLLYGMTNYGGGSGGGVIFQYDPTGDVLTVRHRFVPGDVGNGANPTGSLILDGTVLYGMTPRGGATNLGTVFSFDLATSTFTLLHSFAGQPDDGSLPYGSLLLSGGVLYGMTYGGGTDDLGTVFSLPTSGGATTLLHSFAGGLDDGAHPHGDLVLHDGMLLGMTRQGGDIDQGVIFRVSPTGTPYEVIHDFLGGWDDGRLPYGSLTVCGSLLYGITESGGGMGSGILFGIRNDGSDFEVLHRWAGGDGAQPWVGSTPTLGGGALVGVTSNGGVSGGGVVFSYDLDAPAITSAGATSFTIGQAKIFTVTTTGYPTPVITLDGTLPAGVTFVDNEDGTGTLAGTPAPGTGGTYSLTITASNGAGDDAVQGFTLTVIPLERTTLALASTRNPAPAGAVIKLVAKVTFYSRLYGVPRGTVQFAVNGEPLGGPVPLVSAQATSPAYTMPASNVAVTATYSGDGNFKGSTAKLTQQVSGSLHP